MAWAWIVEWGAHIGGSPVVIQGAGGRGKEIFRLKSQATDFVNDLKLRGMSGHKISMKRLQVPADLVPKKEEEE